MHSRFLLDSNRYKNVGEPVVKLSPDMDEILSDAADFLNHTSQNPIDCPCGSNKDSIVTLSDRHGLAYPLNLCESCGLLRMNPQPGEEELEWYYSELYRPLYENNKSPSDIFWNKLWKGELLEKNLNKAKLDRKFSLVLDIGCGGGWTLKKKHDSGIKCVGYDFSEDHINHGVELGLDLRLGGTDEAIKDQNRGDLLIYSHVLEHVKDPVVELRKLGNLLEKNGILYIETPDIGRIGKRLYGDSLSYWQRAHLWEFQLEHVEYFAKKAGFLIVWSHKDHDSCYVICKKVSTNSEELEFPLLGSRVRKQIIALERKRLSMLTSLVKSLNIKTKIKKLLRH